MTVTLPRLHPKQQEVYDHPARFKTLACGRRWGKTRLSVVIALAAALSGKRVWWVAPSYSQSEIAGRLLRAMLAPYAQLCTVRKAERVFRFTTGGEIWLKSSDRRDNLRGEGIDLLIVDEAAYVADEVWNEVLRPALADRQGKAVIISTPSASGTAASWFRRAFSRGESEDFEDHASWRFTSYDNPYLDESEIEEMRLSMTEAAFRREILALFDTEPEGALWHRAQLDDLRVLKAPPLVRVVVAIDPAVTTNRSSDETALVAAGLGEDDLGYVLASEAGRFSPTEWGELAASLYRRFEADNIIGEVNNGGDLVRHVIRTTDPTLPFSDVRASRGKKTRAEPVSVLYRNRRVHHVGRHAALEDQMCMWDPTADRFSPDLVDALVWGLSDLMLEATPSRLPNVIIPV